MSRELPNPSLYSIGSMTRQSPTAIAGRSSAPRPSAAVDADGDDDVVVAESSSSGCTG